MYQDVWTKLWNFTKKFWVHVPSQSLQKACLEQVCDTLNFNFLIFKIDKNVLRLF